MKFCNIISLSASLISVAAGAWVNGVDIPKEFVTEYERYFNCKDESKCIFNCHKAVRECWMSTNFSSNNCWNLAAACEAIESGNVPKARTGYVSSEGKFYFDLEDPKNPVGVKIPSNLLFYLTQPTDDGMSKMFTERACFNEYYTHTNKGCGDDDDESMKKDIDIEGYKLTKIEYCALFAEVCHNIKTYIVDNSEKPITTTTTTTSAVKTTTTTTTTSTPTQTEESKYKCMAELAGYPCCPKKYSNTVYETDAFGDWGYDYDKRIWCGISPYSEPKETDKCWSELFGYQCCKQCGPVYDEDKNGKWGYEDDAWCGIPHHCKV